MSTDVSYNSVVKDTAPLLCVWHWLLSSCLAVPASAEPTASLSSHHPVVPMAQHTWVTGTSQLQIDLGTSNH